MAVSIKLLFNGTACQVFDSVELVELIFGLFLLGEWLFLAVCFAIAITSFY